MARLLAQVGMVGSGAGRRGMRSVLAATLIAAGTLLAAPSFGADQPKDADLVRDYVHYVRIARYDLALTNAQALLDRLVPPIGKTAADKGGISYPAFVRIVDQAGDLARFEESVTRGMKVSEINEVSSKLQAAYSAGKAEQARDAGEISKNIQMLVGTSRQRLFAADRLRFAGEYAMPQLLETLHKNTDAALSAEVRNVMVSMKNQAAVPLVAALSSVDGKMQEQICGILADIGTNYALPYLYELAADANAAAPSKQAAQAAISRISRGYDGQMNPATLFERLGEDYYENLYDLTPFRDGKGVPEAMQLVWNYVRGAGLQAVPVRAEVFNWTMSMRMAERALKSNAKSREATALWVAANLKREFAMPKDYAHPIYGEGYRDGMYYAVAAGAEVANKVLARALDDAHRDTPLARKAIAAIDRNAGSDVMVSESIGGPLLKALGYPSRRVQFEAALAIASANPRSAFPGSNRVVPTLASAIRDVSARYAVVVSGNAEVANTIAGALRQAGFTVLPPGAVLADMGEATASVAGIDLIVAALPGGATAQTIEFARGNSRMLATPIVALVSDDARPELLARFGRDQTVALLNEGAAPSQIATATGQLLAKNSGGALSAEESADYQSRALTALRDLSIAAGSVFDVADATMPLISAMEKSKGKVREQIAEVLAHINLPSAQGTLADAAMSGEGTEMLMLVGKLTDSAKRFGNLLNERQIKRITELAGKGSDEQATAIAGLIGSLALPNESIVPMLEKSGK